MPKIGGFSYYGKVPENPKKVVSLNSSYTGHLMKLGLNVVGATSYDKKNPVLKDKLSKATEVSSEDLEAVAALKPDVIVVGSTDENVKQMAAIAPTVVVEYGKKSPRYFSQLGKSLWTRGQGQEMVDRMERKDC
ncbi:Iron(III)-hydroxamate-binding protein yxeB [Chlamydia trachomatis]|nr:Iron(III)-hydroxamate-binding protein yxeB [Chlamydia trachomatis]